MNIKRKKVIVTGGAGFIGSHLVESLVGAGNTIRIVDDLSTGKRENVTGLDCEIVVGDVADPALVAKVSRGVDGIFHLALDFRRCRLERRVRHAARRHPPRRLQRDEALVQPGLPYLQSVDHLRRQPGRRR